MAGLFWRLPRWAASSHGTIKYCTTYEATAPVNFDSPPQHAHCRTVGALPKGRQMLRGLTLTRAADVFAKSAFHDGFPLWLEFADEGTIVAILCGENMGSDNDEEDAMRWPLFTWILAGGIFGMFWFVYLLIKQHEKHWRPAAQYMRRRRSHQHRDRTIANA